METKFIEFFKSTLLEAIIETGYMTIMASALATILGFLIAIVLAVTDKEGLRPNKLVNDILGFIVNTIRSFPFIILLVAIIPVTKFIVGKSIGVNAALVPLTIGSAPFIARVIEGALKEVDKGLIEAAKSFGASNTQIIFRVMVKEAMPSIVSGTTLSIISIIGFSAMAGTVGAGGLGSVAITYGYQRFDTSVMIYTVVILIIIVQSIQYLGNLAYKKLK